MTNAKHKDRDEGVSYKPDVSDEALQEITSKAKKDKRVVAVEFTDEQYVYLERVMRHYVTDSMSHAVRMAIVDVGKGLDGNGDIGSRFK